MYSTKQKILGFPYCISGYYGNYLLYFGAYNTGSHANIVKSIAQYFHVPKTRAGNLNWAQFLSKIGYSKSLPANSGIVISPVFETKREVMNFAISLKTNLLVNIV